MGLPWPHPYCNREEIRVFDHEDERFTGLLKQVYGIKVELPSGYNPEGGVRIKFFNFFMGIFFKKRVSLINHDRRLERQRRCRFCVSRTLCIRDVNRDTKLFFKE